ncbi:LLM class flavin-dependent oxidoreductase [Sphaerisporangium dianthi]|uniref:LLM class flavin-dependent oxidoreductase n=1 Tax=Sphaerisporangium dianthi TaxID=1436120 RepID=A0ABV9CAX2_9ACTN
MADRLFRFGIVAGTARDADQWSKLARRAEEMGYATFLTPDTLGTLPPLLALSAAAAATSTLGLGSFVLSVANRRPEQLAWEVNGLGMLSGGRFELGLGVGRPDAGKDAARLGMPFGTVDQRIRRLEEVIRQVRRWPGADGPHGDRPGADAPGTGRPGAVGSGTHRPRVDGSGTGRPATDGAGTGRPATDGAGTGRPATDGAGTGRPATDGAGTGRPATDGAGTGRPGAGGAGGPRVLIAAGGARMLGFAARNADTVALGLPPSTSEDGLADPVRLVRQASDDFDRLELSVGVHVVGDEVPPWLAGRLGPDLPADSIAVLDGSPRQMADRLLRRRDAHQISYITVNAMYADRLAPVVELLSGA